MVTPLAAHLRCMPVEYNSSLKISSLQRCKSLFVAGGTVPKAFLQQMFQPPSWITMVIAATRMHRSLVDFTTGPSNVYDTLFNLILFPLTLTNAFSVHNLLSKTAVSYSRRPSSLLQHRFRWIR
jgi:hypothetical protein